MGQQPSTSPKNSKQPHDLFGFVEILSSSNAKNNGSGKGSPKTEMILIQKQMSSHKTFTQWQKQIKYFMNDDARQIFYLPSTYKFKQQGLCGSAGTLELQCELYKHVLKSEIVNRYHGKLLFEQSQLWYLLYNLLEAAFYVEPAGRKIGDVHPSNIVINQKGRTKVVPSFMLPVSLDNYEKIVQSKISDTFLAPEELDAKLIEKGIYPKVNPCKAEVFSIGVTVLMAATLTDCYYLYPRDKMIFSRQKKEDLMDEVSKHYSKYFFYIMNKMLMQNPQQRRGASDLFRELNRFEDEILSLKDFDRPTCNNEVFVSEPSIADFITPKEATRGKGGSMIMKQQKEVVNKLNNSIQ